MLPEEGVRKGYRKQGRNLNGNNELAVTTTQYRITLLGWYRALAYTFRQAFERPTNIPSHPIL